MGTGKKIAPGAGVYYRGPVEDVRPFQLTISRRLLWWSVPSVILGTIGVLLPLAGGAGFCASGAHLGRYRRTPRSVGVAPGAAPGRSVPGPRRRCRRDATPSQDPHGQRLPRHRLHRRRGCIVVTLFRQPFPLGNGIGVIVQGIFLLFFDFGHARRLPAEVPAWYSPSP
jgi:hypothetical protein